MRILHACLHDVKFQFRHGFYFIYTIMVLFYIISIGFLPDTWKSNATAIVLFADPAALGFFFIGGILLLEKGERVLDSLFVSPLKIWEYVLAKAVSLGLVSTLVGLIISLVGLSLQVNIPVLGFTLIVSSLFYTLIGIIAGVNSKSVNRFLIVTVPVEMLLSTPPIILLFGVKSMILEVMPSSLVLRLFQWCTGAYNSLNPIFLLLGLILWCIPAFYFAVRRMSWFFSKIGGGANERSNKNF